MRTNSVSKYLYEETPELTEVPNDQLRSIITLLVSELDLSQVIKGLVCKLSMGEVGK